MSIRSYFEEEEFILDHISFDHLGGRYQGQGVMTWKPDRGFHIAAFLERHGPSPPRMEFRLLRVVGPEDRPRLRLKPRDLRWAIAPNVDISHRLELAADNRLSLDVPSIITCADTSNDEENQRFWFGSALYAVGNLVLPDNVTTTTRIGDRDIGRTVSAAAIDHEFADGGSILGRLIGNTHLEFQWRLHRTTWTRKQSWYWPEAIRDAFSLASGQDIKLLQRTLIRGGDEYVELRRERNSETIGEIAPFGGPRPLDKRLFIRLAHFLVEGGPNTHICKNILYQITEASRQRTSQGCELLLSTILEAALRTIYGYPFQPGGGHFDVRQHLERFRSDHLGDAWIDACRQALLTWQQLRHRNAHPDWLISEGGAQSQEQAERALDARIFLSRFYGYIILALAGFQVQPTFPRPHREWPPSLMIEHRDPDSDDGG